MRKSFRGIAVRGSELSLEKYLSPLCRPAFAPFIAAIVSPIGQWSDIVLVRCADQLERSATPLDLAEKPPIQFFKCLLRPLESGRTAMIGIQTKTSFDTQPGGSSSTRSGKWPVVMFSST